MNRVTQSQGLKCSIIIWCCLCITVTNSDIELGAEEPKTPGTQRVPAVQGTNDAESLESKQTLNLNSAQKPSNPQSDKLNPKNAPNLNSKASTPTDRTITSNRLDVNTSSTTLRPNGQDPNKDNEGAIERGVLVFVGLGVIVIAYIIFRCVRLNKNRTQMVRKYGVLAHRQDVEMRPLPLDEEDEDDTTVFDVSEVGVHEKPRRNK